MDDPSKVNDASKMNRSLYSNDCFFSLIDLQFATHFLRYKNVDLISYPLYSLKIQYLKLLRLLIWTFLKYFEFRVNYFN